MAGIWINRLRIMESALEICSRIHIELRHGPIWSAMDSLGAQAVQDTMDVIRPQPLTPHPFCQGLTDDWHAASTMLFPCGVLILVRAIVVPVCYTWKQEHATSDS